MSKPSPKARQKQVELGGDSFLDVIANMVGILILLVMIAGLRAQGASQQQMTENSTVAKDLDALVQNEISLGTEVLALEYQANTLAASTAARREERDLLENLVALRRHETDQFRQSLADTDRQRYDLQSSLLSARNSLERLEGDLQRAQDAQADQQVRIESYPTPISRVVHGDEVHFQLLGNRVVPVPMNEIVERLKGEMRRSAQRLRDMPQVTETFGPIGSFRVRYTLGRVDMPMSIDPAGARRGATSVTSGGSFARMFEFSLLPISESIGEECQTALAANSEFQRAVANLNPRSTTVTFWIYPDSFASYRQLKRELYLRGFSVAGRPMPHGELIGGSPQGSKSVAQ